MKWTAEQQALLDQLRARFEAHKDRHPEMQWAPIQRRLAQQPEKLLSLHQMEQSGGEPDVVGFDKKADAYLFYDCAAESPKGRRSLCYDRQALEARKANKPAGTAMDMATAMGVELLTETEYRFLQQLGTFDTKTSSWVRTPADVRKRGGAEFCDRRYGKVFLYHNGADSYYAARGFRGVLRV